MVKTPWAEEEMPFEKAASMGTEKVIRDHATAGILITSDGSFGELGRESFPEAEKRTAEELQKTGKPASLLSTAQILMEKPLWTQWSFLRRSTEWLPWPSTWNG